MLCRLREILSRPEISILLAVIGGLVFVWPFPELIRNAGDFALFLYFFAAWISMVLLAYLISRAIDDQAREPDDV